MIVGNDELMTPRDFRRSLTPALKKLDDGDVQKLVLIQGSEFRYVVLPVAEYEALIEGDAGGADDESA